MSFARTYATKDTWITDAAVSANFGLSPILEVWSNYNNLVERKQHARILVEFALSSLSSSIINQGKYPDPRTNNTVSAFICMTNAKHGESLATNFSLDVIPLTGSWSEGFGLDNDTYTDSGYANSLSASNTIPWTLNNGQTGGAVFLGADNNVYDSNSASQLFTNGQEDLKVDVTEFFKAYLNYSTGTPIAAGGSANNGFLIKMSDIYESNDSQRVVSLGAAGSVTGDSFYTKKFYGRETNTRKAPYFQLEWDGAIRDNRSLIKFSKTGDLYYYNVVDGVLTDLNGIREFPGHVTISANGVNIDTSSPDGLVLTAGRVLNGVYKINIGEATNAAGTLSLTGINIGASSATSFVDSWTITTAGEYVTQNFSFDCNLPSNGQQYLNTSNYQVSLGNLRENYEKGTLQRVKVFVLDKTNLYPALTGTSSAMNASLITNSTFEIRELLNDEVEVPPSAISYDINGNFFNLDTNLLYEGIDYKIVVKINVNGETIVYDYPDKWQFSIGDVYTTNYRSGY